jgi:hypothetical protein
LTLAGKEKHAKRLTRRSFESAQFYRKTVIWEWVARCECVAHPEVSPTRKLQVKQYQPGIVAQVVISAYAVIHSQPQLSSGTMFVKAVERE